MQPHEERVVAEEQELSDKLNKLGAFIHSEKFSALAGIDQFLLGRQDDHMRAYVGVLRERIKRFNKESK